jgi:hypothetical protein
MQLPCTYHGPYQLPAGYAIGAFRTEGVQEISIKWLDKWYESHWRELAAARNVLRREVHSDLNSKRANESDQ